MKFADRLPEPIFTPSTKAETGHDENITFGELAKRIGAAEALRIKETSIRLFLEVGRFALEKGIIVADSKFEFGRDEGDAMSLLVENLLTRLSASDFALLFPQCPLLCTIHHHKQLWWVSQSEELLARL